MRHRDVIERRLALLALVTTLAVAAVGVEALVAVRSTSADGQLLADTQQLLSQQQSADQSHDALRSDVLLAVHPAIPDPAAAQVNVTRDAEAMRQELAGNAAQLVALHDATLTRQYTAARIALDRYALDAERLVALAADPSAAQKALPEFTTQFLAAQTQMAALTTALRRHADRARKAAAATSRRGELLTLEIIASALALVMGLTLAVRRSVRISLTAKTRAEQEVLRANSQLTEAAARGDFDTTLKDALEMATNEPEAYEVVRRAVRETVPGLRAELLIADNSRAHLTQMMTEPGGDGPGCGVLAPTECVAVRRGRSSVFDSATGIGSCPKLAGREGEIGQAVCSPVTFMGEGLGVLHIVSRPGDELAPDALRRLTVTAEQAGNRIGTVRAFSRSQLQATTDGLTGLLNRRTAEERVGELQRQGQSVAVALCDLDHFKQINDTFGHEAGDRALRVFSAVLRTVMRAQDIVARYGGEEFLLVLPDCPPAEAQAVLNRIRTELALVLQAGTAPTFTASFGLAHADSRQPLDETIRHADRALLQAKEQGRDRLILA